MSNSSLKTALGLYRSGDLVGAAHVYGDILRAEPANFEARYLLGVIHYQRGEFSDAEKCMGEALRLNPHLIDASYNRGRALSKLQRHSEALAMFDHVLRLNPQVAEAWAARGKALLDMKRPDEALADFDKALVLNKELWSAWTNRGVALSALGRPLGALQSYDRALSIQPDTATLNNRGNVLCDLKRFEEAANAYERILLLDLNFRYARGNLAFCRLQCCDWGSRHEEEKKISADLRAGIAAAQPGALLAISASSEDQLRCAGLWAANEVPASVNPLWRGERNRHERIRVAYLSADFHAHATAHLMAGVFESHDKERFEISAVSFGPDDHSEMRARLLGAFENFIDIREKSDAAAAALLREMEIDIAIDLKGYTQESRPGILAHRSAPVQAQYLGFAGTMGAPYIDYILADKIVIPECEREFFSEKVVYLPDSYQCNDAKRRIGDRTKSRVEVGLPENGFVFASFNHCFKITEQIFAVWLRLLKRVEGSVLWLLECHPSATHNLRREAQTQGIAPERLVFAPLMPTEDHLARLSQADLFLDTLPYNAHTTASDALWAGVPVLTCMGTTFAGRVAASLSYAAGLSELVTRSLADYEALALTLAREPAALAAYRSRLAGNRHTCPLFDTARFTSGIEAAYTMMWQRQQRGEAPAAFSVQRMS